MKRAGGGTKTKCALSLHRKNITLIEDDVPMVKHELVALAALLKAEL